MKQTLIYLQKEFLEFFRSGKGLILTAVFLLLSLLNPLMTKLTPWLMETLSDSLGEAGLIVGEIKVDAATSWQQFFKNAPMFLLVFLLLFGGIFTNEYPSGSLLLIVTKGVKRSCVLFAKAATLFLVWTAEYWLAFLVTYGYNAFYWDNGVVENLFLSGVCWWVFGVWLSSLVLLFSTFVDTTSLTLLGVGGGVFLSYLLGIVPTLKRYTPTYLTGGKEPLFALLITAALSIAGVLVSIPLFNRKKL